ICGSATFAMDVSSTSMNVASVTLTAISQGLIVPSGNLSLVRILSRIASNLWPCAVSTYYRSNPYPYSTLIRNHRRIHVHPRPQDGLLRRNRVQHDLHGDPLHDFHVISRRVLRRQQAQHGTRCPRNRIHSSAESLSVRIHLDFCFLPGLHVPQLRLFEIRRHPHGLERQNHQQSLPCLCDLSRFHLFVRGHAIDRRGDLRVAQVQLRRFQRRSRLFHLGEFRLGIRSPHAHLLDVRVCRGYSRTRLLDSRLCRVQLRLGNIHVAPRLRQSFLVRLKRARGGICIGFGGVVLLF